MIHHGCKTLSFFPAARPYQQPGQPRRQQPPWALGSHKKEGGAALHPVQQNEHTNSCPPRP